MAIIKEYDPSMQQALEACYRLCLDALGWDYEPEGRHSDILSIEDTYMRNGCFWCLYEGDLLIGMGAARCIDDANKTAELKRLYILPEHHGKGYGDMLFRNALDYVKAQGYKAVRLDTQHDRAASLHLIKKYRFRQIESYNDNTYAALYFELDLSRYKAG